MARRWTTGRHKVSGVPMRVVEGAKVPGDLRLEWWDGRYWVPVKMELAFFLVDFFTENEQHIKQYRSWWRQNGDRYFLDQCVAAVRDGWQAAADRVRRQRENVA